MIVFKRQSLWRWSKSLTVCPVHNAPSRALSLVERNDQLQLVDAPSGQHELYEPK